MTAKKLPKTAGNTKKPAAKPRKRPETPEIVTNYQALLRTIAELRAAGQLTELDQARIQIALGLAAAVDAMPDNPSMWREYRAAEKALREEASAHGDPFDQLLASITAEVRDQEKPKKQDTRPRS